jgi:ketosteroid isomerase-like protein
MTIAITVEPASDADIACASEAVGHWQRGTAEGDWSGLIGMLDEDVTFRVPLEQFAGTQRGIPQCVRFFDHVSSILRADVSVSSVLANGSRVGFEVDVRGILSGEAYVQSLFIVFVVRHRRVLEFREFLAWPGGLAPG